MGDALPDNVMQHEHERHDRSDRQRGGPAALPIAARLFANVHFLAPRHYVALPQRGGMPSPTIYMYVVAASKARQCRFPGAAIQKTKGSGVLGGVPRRRIVRVLRRRISNRQQEDPEA